MTWEYKTAEDYCESVRDGTHDTPKQTETGYKLVTGKHIKNGQIDATDAYYISEKDYLKINERSLVEQWDVLMSMIGTVGEVAVVNEHPDYAIKNIALFKCGGSQLKGKWLSYYLRSAEAQGQMVGNQKGSSQQFLSLKQLRALPVPITDEYHMQRIVDILSAYDDLIENNQKQIKLLEEAAQRLYKEWFVDLRFPGHETTPIIDGIPQGWRECSIADLCKKINAGGTPSRKNANYWNNGNIKWFKTQELQDCWLIDSDEKISDTGQKNSSAKFFPTNTILMAIYASPTLGRLGILDSEATCNQAALCLLVDESQISWQWLYQKLYELREHYNGIARGAGQQNISGEVVKQTIVLCPSKQLMDSFTQSVSPLFERRRLLQKQNLCLTEARDRLLPKLMGGELEV
ncbi:MAG: restriction endonuclease subunit S [Clostridia bacterium]|nr:restriction endonuclease subunit S [Clostridia bacterium]